LQDILSEHSGPSPVYFIVGNGRDSRRFISRSTTVTIDEMLMADLKKYAGEEAIKIENIR